jgi:outer membrane protein assembly factor BamB
VGARDRQGGGANRYTSGMAGRRGDAYGRAAVVCLLALLALVAAGCGGSDDSDDTKKGAAGHQQAADESSDLEDWPMFGRIKTRTQHLSGSDLNPPLKETWAYQEGVLIEFPPALYDGVLYLADKAGDVRAIRASSGDTIWHIKGGGSANGAPDDTTGPAYFHGRVFVAMQHGEVFALDPETGKEQWRRRLPTQLESSPLVIRGTLYIGSDKGILYALDTRNGKIRWQYKAAAEAVKTSPSYAAGKIYFADYGGAVHAISAKNGKPAWKTETDGKLGSGGYYSSPTLAAGKLFIGRDDGAFFAIDQGSGKVLWSKQTGKPIIGSPAVAKSNGVPLSVYIGNYAGTLYAFKASGGAQRWKYDVGGAIPGTPTVVGTTVYTSSFHTQEALGIDTDSGKKVFRFAAPGYTPMISDGQRLYLTGYESLRALEPR